MALKIGFTEQGDAGLNLSWTKRLDTVDGAILITKNANKKFRDAVLATNDTPLIVHVGCTGLGQTPIEPNVPEFHKQIENALELVHAGFPKRRIVLRIDPIIPAPNCLAKAAEVLDTAYATGLLDGNDGARVRMSIFDEYRHVKARIKALGFEPFYEGDRFYATDDEMRLVTEILRQHIHGTTVETCAEPHFVDICQKMGLDVVAQGCLSAADLDLMGIPAEKAPAAVNGQNRHGCLCLRCKTELLRNKRQCPHKCVYCYWQNA